MTIIERRGLDESLEAFATRYDLPIDEARTIWRSESLRLLHAWVGHVVSDDLLERGLCRIAPGVAVPAAGVVWSDEP